MFDNVCKFLAETFPADLAQWLLGEAVPLSELSPSELSLEPIRADSLILLQSENLVLHVEFQTHPDASIPFRMLDYWVRAYRRFPERTIHQVVIYLKENSSTLTRQSCFESSRTRHAFEVIRLWEQPVQLFLGVSGLLPFAVLGKTDDRAALLQNVADQLEKIVDCRTQNNLAASTAILAGLVLEKALIQRVLRKEIMRESVIYQEITAEARAEGKAEGKAEGERSLILKLLARRVGSVPQPLQTQINQLPLETLEALGEALLDFSSLDDLVAWLSNS
jgi:predicted transposase/invertase (TIGR01784 family)